MKKVSLFFVTLMGIMAASCSNESVELSSEQTAGQSLAPVTVSVSGFSVDQGEFPAKTRATTAVAEASSVKFITLAFYKSDGTEVYKHTQNRNDATTHTTFGEFSTSLMYGRYTMVVVANAGTNAITVTSPAAATYGENSPMDTWVKTDVVNITSSTAVNLSAVLDRICSALAVQSTDNRPAEVTHIRYSFSAGGRSFSPTTGLATSNTGFVTTMDFTSAVGSTTSTGGYLFLDSNDQTMDITIETLDAADGNVLFSKTVTDVPMKRNRITVLRGAIYSGTDVSAGFQVNTTWLDDHSIEF